jgi:Family of unknown function (DUF5760)
MESEWVEKIKEWLQIDTEINNLINLLKEKRKEKKNLTDILMQAMKQKEIEVVNLNDGSIEIKSNKVKSPLNKKHLLSCLSTYYGENLETSKVEELVKHILSNRDEKVKEYIKRTTKT